MHNLLNRSVIFMITILLLVSSGNYTLFANETVPVYLNKNNPVAIRIADLMRRMTIEEKIAQMCQYVGLEHIKSAEKNTSLKQLKNNDANSFYPGLKIEDVEKMV